jgi:hypothetical protein
MASEWRVVEGLELRTVEEGVIGVSKLVGAAGGGMPMKEER